MIFVIPFFCYVNHLYLRMVTLFHTDAGAERLFGGSVKPKIMRMNLLKHENSRNCFPIYERKSLVLICIFMARNRFNGNFHKNLFVFDPYRPHKEGYKLWWNLGLLYGLIVASILQLNGMLFYESVLTENDLIQRLPYFICCHGAFKNMMRCMGNKSDFLNEKKLST